MLLNYKERESSRSELIVGYVSIDMSAGWAYQQSRKSSLPPVPDNIEGSTNFGAVRAAKTVGAFKRKGYQASMMRKNGWYQVCVGSYLNKKEAEADFKNFSQKYKDCFLRAKNK